MAELKRTSLNFRVPISDLVLREKVDRYEKARGRVTSFRNKKNISDKEIIEHLEEEIEQYRDRIENLERIIKNSEELNKTREVYTERNTYHCGVDGGTGKDFTVIRWYEDGVLFKEEIKPGCN